MVSMVASAAAHAIGFPPYVPPSPPTWGASMISARPVTPAKRQPVGDALGGDDEVGIDAVVLTREHRTRAGEPGLHLVGDEDHAVLPAPIEQRRQEAFGGNDETALALDRLDDHGGQVVGADLLVDDAQRPLGGQLAVGGELLSELRVAERIGHRCAVDLGGERSEAVLVGHRLGGQGHREVGATVVRVVERDDRLLVGEGAGNLDGVLDGLGARVEQCRPGLAPDGSETVQVLADRDVALIRGDHETGMSELGHLRRDRVDDPG